MFWNSRYYCISSKAITTRFRSKVLISSVSLLSLQRAGSQLAALTFGLGNMAIISAGATLVSRGAASQCKCLASDRYVVDGVTSDVVIST